MRVMGYLNLEIGNWRLVIEFELFLVMCVVISDVILPSIVNLSIARMGMVCAV